MQVNISPITKEFCDDSSKTLCCSHLQHWICCLWQNIWGDNKKAVLWVNTTLENNGALSLLLVWFEIIWRQITSFHLPVRGVHESEMNFCSSFDLSEVVGVGYGLYYLAVLFMVSVMAGSSTRFKLSVRSGFSILWNTLMSLCLPRDCQIRDLELSKNKNSRWLSSADTSVLNAGSTLRITFSSICTSILMLEIAVSNCPFWGVDTKGIWIVVEKCNSA